jgi:hypothetical protein
MKNQSTNFRRQGNAQLSPLPEGDTDYATCWRLLKTYVSKAIPQQEHRSLIRIKNGERGIWHGIIGSTGYAANLISSNISITYIAIL